jgi:diaminohydroxyphosphoribosylaminopyrimidine deaminase/5-amino-6-(5-phosphoribosylamino)uracil reductase
MNSSEIDSRFMSRALELAARGQGHVEPNPMVGCVIARGEETIAEGWHQEFGQPHAEIEALSAVGSMADGATMYVTLEPCCHQGKTGPCTDAIVKSGIHKVVIAQRDPFPQVDGSGIRHLEAAGIEVEVGLLEQQAAALNAPYVKLVTTGRPWVIAKWAMTLDGKLATKTGDSRWISNEKSRGVVHRLRRRVDAVVVGRGTAQADDPLLTARPPGPRAATRIVVDSQASLSTDSQLVRSSSESPTLIAVGPSASIENRNRLTESGCEVVVFTSADRSERFDQLLVELGRRRMTNVLIEGGAELLGNVFDMGAIDEVHVFIAPKLVGAVDSASIQGVGIESIGQSLSIESPRIQQLEGDVYVSGRIRRPS